jgi:hypothetical protein
MKFSLVILLLIALTPAWADLWERNDKLVCVQTKTNVDAVKKDLHQKYGKDCDYLRDSTRIVIGNIFKCPDDKVMPYFRTQKHCEMFFAEGKKDLLKFAPAGTANPKKWITIFGSCMEKASQKQINSMGLKSLDKFCICIANKTTDQVTGHIVNDCSKTL